MASYYHIKNDVSFHEYNMHNYIYNMLSDQINLPRPVKYDRVTKQLVMQLIGGLSVADFYGESSSQCPKQVMNEVRRIINVLKNNNIIYPDITGYNFIEDGNGKVWILDFEHCYFDYGLGDPFIKMFIEGCNEWNPDFA